jgi:hypothetical protein
MKSPTTTVELAGAIESLIASYIDDVRAAAEQAVTHGLAQQGQEVGRRSPKSPVRRSVETKSPSSRRTASALDEACQALCDLVRAQPGSSMVEFSEHLGSSVRELQRPMAKLRSDGRVRSIGERHLMRYFPAVTKASKE